MSRDEFTPKTKDNLARRTSQTCSNPACKAPTSGPHKEPQKSTNVGVAAHITAASAGGPRYDVCMTADNRASIQNAIWLCQTCSKLVDTNPTEFSSSKLHHWKNSAESEATRVLGRPAGTDYYPQTVCPTGLAQCTFMFIDLYDNFLTVITAGEAIEDMDIVPSVWSWQFEHPE